LPKGAGKLGVGLPSPVAVADKLNTHAKMKRKEGIDLANIRASLVPNPSTVVT
jgi:hypothetical protein